MIIKKWNDKLLSINVVTNGKITGKKSIVRNNSVAARSNNSQPDANFIEVNCAPDGVEFCELERFCYVEPDGLVHSCGEWELVIGSCYCEPNEGGGGGGPDDCELHGIGCDDGPPPPGGGEDNPPEDEPEPASFNFSNVFAVKISGSSGTNENWYIRQQVTLSGMKFPSNPANNYYTTFVESCLHNNYNPAYGGLYGNTNSLVYCYINGGHCTSNSVLTENDKKFTNTSSAVVNYPNYHAPNSPVTPFSVSYSNTKHANSAIDFN